MWKKKTFHLLAFTLSFLAALFSLVPPVLAGDTPTFGTDMARTRCLESNAPLYHGFALYGPGAKYCPLGPGLESYSTPTEYKAPDGTHVVLAYAFKGQNGYLYGVQEKDNAITGLWGGPVAFPAHSALDAAGVCGPTTEDGCTAIGVGKYLYVWPNQYISNQIDAADIPGAVWYQIRGNPGNTLYQVSMTPAITKPVTWSGLDDNFNTVTWTAPAVVVGSWDGGITVGPVYKPANIPIPPQIFYCTTQTDPSSGTADITSSPAYIPGGFAGIGTGDGNGVVVLGISGIRHPWLVAMDPGTGQCRTFGGGPGQKQVLAAGVSSSPVWSGRHLYVPDNAGDLYAFNSDGSLLKAAYVGGKDAGDISNIALGPDYVYAVEDDLTRLYAYTRAGGTGEPFVKMGSWAPGNGAQMYSPTLVFNPGNSFSNIYIGSNTGQLFSMAFGGLPSIFSEDGSGLVNSGVDFIGALFSGEPLEPFGSVLADAGPDHLLAAWTNEAGQSNTGGLEFWTPTSFTAKAFFTQDMSTMTPVECVLPSGCVTLVAVPVPMASTTQVRYQAPDNTGWQPWLSNYMVPANSCWYASLTAPSQPGTYTVTVTALDASGQTATATADLTVQDTIHTGSSTMVNGRYLHVISYGLPGGFDMQHDPRPCPELTGSLYDPDAVQTKLADCIHCEEIIPQSDILAEAPNPKPGKAHLDGINWGEWRVRYVGGRPQLYMITGTAPPVIHYVQGSPGPAPGYGTIINYPSAPMMENNSPGNMEATFTFKENWAGFEPHGDNYYITTNPATGKKTEELYNPILGYSVSSQVWVTAIYKYDPPPPLKGPAPPPEFFPEAVEYNSTVPIEITGTDVYLIPATGGSDLWRW